jgi:hypothetical protein
VAFLGTDGFLFQAVLETIRSAHKQVAEMMSRWAAMGNSAEPVVGNQVTETIQRGKIHNVKRFKVPTIQVLAI